MTIHERLKAIVDRKGMTQNAFAKKVGILAQTLGNYLKKERDPNFETLEKISLAFPDINMRWVLTGRGRMILPEQPFEEQEVKEDDFSYKLLNTIGSSRSVRERIQDVLDFKQCDLSELSEKTGIPEKSLGRQLEGKEAVTIDMIRSLCTVYPDVSFLWILTGNLTIQQDRENFQDVMKRLDSLYIENVRLSEELGRLKQENEPLRK